jgi:hypothetical protein
VDLDRYEVTRGALADDIARLRRVDRVEANVGMLRIGLLQLDHVRLAKAGDRLDAHAGIRATTLRDVVPTGFGVEPVERDGQLGFRAAARLAGVAVTADGRVVTRGGGIVLEPDGPFGGIAAVRLFTDERVAVERIGARSTGRGFVVTTDGRFR